MLLTIQSEQIQQIIPDANAAKAAKKLAKVEDWNNKGASTDQWIWAEIKGSAIYQSAIFLPQLKCECSCPSFKRPCKHALALLMVYEAHADQFQIQEDESQFPERVQKWRSKATKSTEDKAKPTKPVDEAARAKRQQSRELKMDQGIESLQTWLIDITNLGLNEIRNQRGQHWFKEISTRLVDAQISGLIAWIDEFSSVLYQEQWQKHSAIWLARLQLITELWNHQNNISEDLKNELRQLFGVTIAADYWQTAAQQNFKIFALGASIQELNQSKGTFRRQWLWDEKTLTDYLVLDFNIPPHTRFGLTLPALQQLEFKATSYPGIHQQRLKLADDFSMNSISKVTVHADAPQGFAYFDQAFARYAEKLGGNPLHILSFWWVNQLRLSQAEGHFYLVDQQNKMLPVEISQQKFYDLWMLVTDRLFHAGLEWDGIELKMISLWHGAHFQCL